eukprot:Lithocolla_globosa_v1_NODE_24_length_9285_cov_66.491832.p10 type:complete len:126 gc:universal NODE_24_length_9285_cov_66.491832:3200-2823(-)
MFLSQSIGVFQSVTDLARTLHGGQSSVIYQSLAARCHVCFGTPRKLFFFITHFEFSIERNPEMTCCSTNVEELERYRGCLLIHLGEFLEGHVEVGLYVHLLQFGQVDSLEDEEVVKLSTCCRINH